MQLVEISEFSVIAVCHTHPTTNTNPCEIDRQNPMVPVRGHIAIVIPIFAQIMPWELTTLTQWKQILTKWDANMQTILVSLNTHLDSNGSDFQSLNSQ